MSSTANTARSAPWTKEGPANHYYLFDCYALGHAQSEVNAIWVFPHGISYILQHFDFTNLGTLLWNLLCGDTCGSLMCHGAVSEM